MTTDPERLRLRVERSILEDHYPAILTKLASYAEEQRLVGEVAALKALDLDRYCEFKRAWGIPCTPLDLEKCWLHKALADAEAKLKKLREDA